MMNKKNRDNKYFFRVTVPNLNPDIEYEIKISGTERNVLKTKTLKQLKGARICRFALFGDPHITGPDTRAELPVEYGPRLYSKAVWLHEKYIKRAADQTDPETSHRATILALRGGRLR